MKFVSFSSMAIAIVLQSTSTVATDDRQLRGGNNRISNGNGHRILEEDQIGTFLTADIEYGPEEPSTTQQGNRPDYTYNIELTDGTIFEVKNAQTGWAAKLSSGVDKIKIPKGAIVSGAEIDVKGGKPDVVPGNADGRPFDRHLQESERTPEQERNLAELRRQQRELRTGNRSVLAVRVTHTGLGAKGSPTDDLAKIGDDIFGTYGDQINMVSQYADCSHGQLNFAPIASGPRASTNGKVSNIANGMVEVEIDNVDCSAAPSTGCDGQLRNAVNSILYNAFGTSASNLANHVMHCMPDGVMNGIAYAYINSWNSVYKNRWCQYTSAQLHEIGHNINLAHSNEAGAYRDQTGFMGYSYGNFNDPMCFNNAKSFQLGWFNDAVVTLSAPGDSFAGDLTGQVNYVKNSGQVVIVRIVTSIGDDLFIGFNHKALHNINTREAGNQVTVQEYSGSGYSESELKAKIIEGGSWNGASGTYGNEVTIQVASINTTTGKAYVYICYGNCTPSPPTMQPSRPPTKAPVTPSPTKAPVTPLPTNPPTLQPTNLPTNPPTDQPTPEPSPGPTSPPTTEPPTPVPSPGPTPLPTSQPTDFPTNPPTLPPTSSPTLPGFCSDGTGRCSTSDLSQCACYPPATRRLEEVFGHHRKLQSCSDARKRKDCRAPCFWDAGLCLAPVTSPPTRQPSHSPTKAPVTSSPTKAPVTPQPTNPVPCECSMTAPPTQSPTTRPTFSPTTRPTSSSPTTSKPTGCPICSVTSRECCGTCRDWGKPSRRGCVV